MNHYISLLKFIAAVVIAVAACMISTPALAACQLVDGQYPYVGNVDLGNIPVGPDAPIGKVLATVEYIPPSPDDVGWVSCDANNNGGWADMSLTAARASISEHIFDSGVPGVGYKVKDGGGFEANADYRITVYEGKNQISRLARFTLVKTGPISPGTFSKGLWASTSFGGLGFTQFQVIGGGIAVSTCSAIGPQTIDLGRLSARVIDSATSAGDNIINIPMNCGAGIKIFAKLTGTAPPGSTATGLIQNSGTASGVSVQLIDGNKNPIRLGDKIEQPNNGANTIYKIGARAYKTGTVGAGTINAQATLTMTYE